MGKDSGDNLRWASLYSLGINALLAAGKFALAAASGSLALAADAMHSLVDVLGSFAVLAGLSLAGRRSTAFPYGLYKAENMVSVVMALLIALAGYEIARESLLSQSGGLINQPLAVAGAAFALAISYASSRRQAAVARQSGSPSLLADSQHFRVDALSSLVVLLALLGEAAGLPLDRFGAIAIVLFIARASWGLLVDGIKVLLDASLDADTLARARQVVLADPTVAEVASLVGRNSGRYKFLEMTLRLRTADLAEAQLVSKRIESRLKQEIPLLDRIVIRAEPLRKETWRLAVPLAEPAGAVSTHFALAPWFALAYLRPATGEVTEREVLANPYLFIEKQKGIRVAEFLVSQGVDILALRESIKGKGPDYVLAAARVQVWETGSEDEGGIVEEAFRLIAVQPSGGLETAALAG